MINRIITDVSDYIFVQDEPQNSFGVKSALYGNRGAIE